MSRLAPPASPGTLLDGYSLVARRDDQGLGEVWLGERPHAPDDRAVVKFIAPAPPGSATAPREFDERVKQLARVTSPNLAGVRRGGLYEGWLFTLNEFIEARTLESWLAGHREARTLPPPGVALWVFDAICGALQGAHRQGLAHGALSPRSVLLRLLAPGTYHTWVLDLGLSPWLREASEVSEVENVSPRYLAPEQGSAAAPTPRSDVFALGVLLVELLTLTTTPGGNPREPIARYVQRDFGSLTGALQKLREDIHEDFWFTVSEALDPDAAQRPENAQQFKTRVRAAARNAALWRDAPEPAPEPPMPRERRETATESSPAARGRDAVAPEGWQHSERMLVDDAIRALARDSVRGRKQSVAPPVTPAPVAVVTAPVAPPVAPVLPAPPVPPVVSAPVVAGVMAPPWTKPPPREPPAPLPVLDEVTSPSIEAPAASSFAEPDETVDGTVRTSALPVTALTGATLSSRPGAGRGLMLGGRRKEAAVVVKSRARTATRPIEDIDAPPAPQDLGMQTLTSVPRVGFDGEATLDTTTMAVVPVDATVDLVLPESALDVSAEVRREAPPAPPIEVAVEEATLGASRRIVTRPPIPETLVAKTPASILAQGLPTRSTPAPLVIQTRAPVVSKGRSPLWWAIPLAVVFVAMMLAALYVVVRVVF